ncbi:MAG: iron-containing redox enzyme family protein [Stenomitos frigidus ULC029]
MRRYQEMSDRDMSDRSMSAVLHYPLTRTTAPNYDEAEQLFLSLLDTPALDDQLEQLSPVCQSFEKTLAAALTAAYGDAYNSSAAHRFLQRVLYRINRLKFFWYDDLSNYENERSLYLQKIRNQIEAAWQAWELDQLDVETLKQVDVVSALRDRAAADLEPELSATGRYFQDEMTAAGYRKMLEIASLDGLVEASQLSRTLGGVANEIHSVMTRLLVEEYGAGKLARKHSTYFATMLSDLGMSTAPEAYFDAVPWEVLATINHSFLLSERKRDYLRYAGGLLYTEISVPAGFSPYHAAAQRLGLSDNAMSYWTLHIKVDKLHGRWMLDEVALPLVDRYPAEAWELVLGYDQQRLMGDRAGEATARAVREADAEG